MVYYPPLREVRAGTEGRNLEAGTEACMGHGGSLLAHSPWLAQVLSHTSQDPLAKGLTTHSGQGLCSSIVNQEKIP